MTVWIIIPVLPFTPIKPRACIPYFMSVVQQGFWADPSVAKVGGLQSQGAKGAAEAILLQALGNAGSGVLRLFPMSIKQG